MTSAHPPTAMPTVPTPEPAWDIARKFAFQGQWTVDDGLGLPDNRRVEVSHGYDQVLPVPTDHHQVIVGLLYRFWSWADLTIEVVSDEYRAHDLETKRRGYAQAGIPQYWIVDPPLRRLTVLRLDAGNTYEPAGLCRLNDRAGSVLLPGFAVDVTAVFNPDRRPPPAASA